MPTPPSRTIAGLGLSHFMEGGEDPQAARKLADAVAKVVESGLRGFVTQVFMGVGVPSNAIPPNLTGSLVGPGRLEGPTPTKQQLMVEAGTAARNAGILPGQQAVFAETVAERLAEALEAMRTHALVPPGTPVAGGVTAAPASITFALGPIKSQLSMVDALRAAPKPGPGAWVAATPQVNRARPLGPLLGGTRGAAPPPNQLVLPAGFAAAVTATILAAIEQAAPMIMVAPGVPTSAVTTGPGRLM